MKPTSALPRGTPTFLFTDIEGSTRLLHALGDRYAEALARHRVVLAGAIERRGGVVFGTEGDALFAAFEGSAAAVVAAVEAQQLLAAEPWPDDTQLRVRMGLHTGDVVVVDDDYVGMTVHIAARVAAAGHGGQILVTGVVAGLAVGLDTTDLGKHELKDVGEHHLLQVRAPGLDVEFPPLRSLSSLPNNLPAAVDVFVGRHTELVEIGHGIAEHRLVTLVGPGGSGKTRLALEVATGVLPRFAHGVWFVDLAAIDDSGRVASMAAQAVQVRQQDDEPLLSTLTTWLTERSLLLVLDNCEHVLDGVTALCHHLLASCPELRVLATSREYLGIRGEVGIQTEPLQDDAVDLFLTRAVAAVPSFDVSSTDRMTIARICRRLDGLPLAIELAAARLRGLSLDQLESRLDDGFRVLRSSDRTEVDRHRTLEAVVAWSYELLAEDERRLFECLAVFPHQFSMEMAETVAAGGGVDEIDVVELLARLVEKSLVVRVGPRYQLLETLRQFGLERLRDRGEVEVYRDRLLDVAMATVDELETVMRTAAMDEALRDATADAVTHRSAMQWAIARGRLSDALRIASVVPLSPNRGERYQEIGERMAAAQHAGELDDASAGHAWAALGNISFERGDWDASSTANERAIAAFAAAGNPRLAAWSKYLQVHSRWGAGDLEAVDRYIVETIEHFRATQDQMGLGYSLWVASQRQPDLDEAEAAAAEADALLRQVGVPMGIAHNVEGRGIIALEQGQRAEAASFVAEAVRAFADYGNLGCTAHALEAAAVVLSWAGWPEGDAVEMLAAAEQFRTRSAQSHRPWEIRARGGTTAARIEELDRAASSTPATVDLDLATVAAHAVDALAAVDTQVARER